MKKKSLTLKVVIFWSAIIVLTAGFIVTLCLQISTGKSIDSISDIENTDLEIYGDVLSEEDNYFVYIYSSDDNTVDLTKKQEVEPAVFSYFTYVKQNKRNSDITPIYAYSTEHFAPTPAYATVSNYLASLDSNLNVNKTPILIEVEDYAVSSVYTTINQIQNALQTEMEANDD
ncbi:MAG: hypothetical protein WCR33_01485 [Bacilli bacterium]